MTRGYNLQLHGIEYKTPWLTACSHKQFNVRRAAGHVHIRPLEIFRGCREEPPLTTLRSEKKEDDPVHQHSAQRSHAELHLSSHACRLPRGGRYSRVQYKYNTSRLRAPARSCHVKDQAMQIHSALEERQRSPPPSLCNFELRLSRGLMRQRPITSYVQAEFQIFNSS